jgi:hypothetical protein
MERPQPARILPMRSSLRALLLPALLLPAVLGAPSAAAAVPTPSEYLGFEPGADYRLASYDRIQGYFRELAAGSDRVELRTIGRSVLGRELHLAIISSPRNLAQLDRYRTISERLARGRATDAEVAELAAEGRAVVWVDGGLHATELAHGQMVPTLAHRVATEETPEMRHIRDQVIFLLMPNINPDGLEIVREWYERTLGTPWERTNPPELYHHYVGHDNNRDFFMNNMPESRASAAVLYREWFPQIVYNQHQISPTWARIVLPPYSDPVNPAIHPGVTTALNEIGGAMAHRLTMEDLPGAISDVGFSMWWNGGQRTVPYFHNMIGILTETGHNWPTPAYYDPALFPRMQALRYRATAGPLPEGLDGVQDGKVLHADPWPGGESHFSEPVRYMVEASVAVLRSAADRRERLLTNIHRMARDAIVAGETATTRAYVVPADQRHADEARNLVDVLYEGGVEIERTTGPVTVAGRRVPAGSFLIPAAQAFRPYVVDLLEKQRYPDAREDPGGTLRPPYDITGWTLPYQMGVEVLHADRVPDTATEPVTAPIPVPEGTIAGRGGAGWLLGHEQNASVRAVNDLLAHGVPVHWTRAAFRAAGQGFAAGTFFVPAGGDAEARVREAARAHGLDFTAVPREPGVELEALRRPRVGLYKSYVAFMDEGWTRWLLEDYGFDVVSLTDPDLRTGTVPDGLDAIVLPHADGSAFFTDAQSRILTGHPPGSMPEAFTGGMGLEGAVAIKRFVEDGGTLLTFGAANDLVIRLFGLPVRNVVAGAPGSRFSIPGTLLRATVDPDDELAYGMPPETSVTFVRGAAFTHVGQKDCIEDFLNQGQCWELRRGGRPLDGFPEPIGHDAVVRFAEDELVLSGWAVGEEHIAGHTAMARVGLGDGAVVLYGFRPQFRGQPRATYKLVFNALLAATAD